MKSVFHAILIFSLLLTGCATPEPERKPNKYDNATTANDLFPVEQGMPVREVKKNQEFFFKKCEQVNSRPFYNKVEFECNEN